MKQLLTIFTVIFTVFSSGAQTERAINFQTAYNQFPNVTPGVLEAIAWENTRMIHLENISEGCSGIPVPYGIMGLHDYGKGYFIENGKLVEQVSGVSIEEQKALPQKQIEAYAATYSHLMQAEINNGGSATNPESIYGVLLQLSEIPDSGAVNLMVRDKQVFEIFQFISSKKNALKYGFSIYSVDYRSIFGNNLSIFTSKKLDVSSGMVKNERGQTYTPTTSALSKSTDYGPAIWNPTSCNFSTRNSSISAITIHTVQGSYLGAISWAQNCTSSSVSYHYVISFEGEITQLVHEVDKAWHVGSENDYTIGYEHEGYVSNPNNYTDSMYFASADLSRDIINSGYGISGLRTYYGPATAGLNTIGACTKIKGHQHYPNQSHTDPGQYWDWERYYKLINNNPTITTITSQSGVHYDSGGAGGNYQDDERYLWLIQPTNAQSVTLNFTSFDLEYDYDFLFIYDGDNTDAPLIGKYTGTNSPGTITSSGGSLLIEFRSDCGTTNPGWVADYSSILLDSNPPTTAVAPDNIWHTDDFTVDFTDFDNETGVEDRYYLVAKKQVTDNSWKAGSAEFAFEDFEDDMNSWTNQTGTFQVMNGEFNFVDVNQQNSNAYMTVQQDQNNAFLYEWDQTFVSTGTNQRAGLHFFCDDATLPNRGNSYFVYYRESDDQVQIYRVTNDVFNLEATGNVTVDATITCKVAYDPTTGVIEAYLNDSLVTSWQDPTPITAGNSVSFRSGGCAINFDNLTVSRSRGSQVLLTAGFTDELSIESEGAQETGMVRSIVIDSMHNWSLPAQETYLLDFTAPTFDYLNDGTGSDIDTFYNGTVDANWNMIDIHSSIADYEVAIGTLPLLDDVYPWSSNGVSGAISHVLSNPIYGEVYHVSVRGINGAGLQLQLTSNGQKLVDPTVSLGELTSDNILVYPNPASELIKVDGAPNGATFTIYDNRGRVVLASDTNTIQLDSLANGNYQLMIEHHGAFVLKQIIVKK